MTTKTKSDQIGETQRRQRRAYAIVKRLAMEAGYMDHERDTAGFVEWCDEFDKLNPAWIDVKMPESKIDE